MRGTSPPTQCLIFGGSGFIGRHLAQALSPELPTVLFDLQAPAPPSALPFEVVDVRRPIQTQWVPAPGAAIVHLAAVHRTPGHPAHEYFEANVRGAEQVLAYARRQDVRTILFSSSIAVYGTSEPYKDEASLPMPDTPYGISKLVAEHLFRTWQAEAPAERRLIIVRPGVVFGEGENGNVTRLVNSMARGRFVYPGRRDTIKACIYIKDLVAAMRGMLWQEPPGVALYNMSYAPAPSVAQICAAAAKVGHLSPPRFTLPALPMLWAAGLIFLLRPKGNIHPARIRKLMISNNIGGEKLAASPYVLPYGLEKGLADWMEITNFARSKRLR